jgi:fructose-1,6-bisphosphatase II / sedoheptulose-1,7-bisphosphatase
MELVRVTERAAVAAARLRGHGDEKAADQAAVDAMRRELNRLPIDGEIVIGEGERDEAPMLYHRREGRHASRGRRSTSPSTRSRAPRSAPRTCPGSIAVMAMAEAGQLLYAPDVYMDKIAIGPGICAAASSISTPRPTGQHQRAGQGQGREAAARSTTLIMDRPRHAKLIEEVRKTGCLDPPDHRWRRRRRDLLHRAGQDRHRPLSRHRRRALRACWRQRRCAASAARCRAA